MIATNNKRINAFAERLIDRIANDGPPKSQMPDGSYEVDIWSEEDFIRIIREEAAKPEWQEPNIEAMMSLSTDHLSQDAKDWLDACGEANLSNFPYGGPISTLGRTEYGYFMHAPDIMGGSNPQGMPASLRAICAYVRDHDCAYVLFDSDADGVEDLSTFEMDEREGPRPGVAPDDGGNLADELTEPEKKAIIEGPSHAIIVPDFYIFEGNTYVIAKKRDEVAEMVSTLTRTADLIDEAVTTHIYDEGNGDVIPDDCPYTEAADELRKMCVTLMPLIVGAKRVPTPGRTDREIVDQTNDLAIRALGWLFGVAAPKDWKCYEARDSCSKKAWGVACEIQEFMTATDPNDALSNIEE